MREKVLQGPYGYQQYVQRIQVIDQDSRIFANFNSFFFAVLWTEAI